MTTKQRFTLNSVIAILLTLGGIAGFIWTFSMRLRPMELFIPRIALATIAIGGVLIILKDLIKPEQAEVLSKQRILPYAIGVSVAIWLYSWAFRNIGLVTSTFLFLTIWWIWVAFRDAKRKGSFESFRPKIVKLMALAVSVSVVVHLLFVTLLRMHMPRTLLP